MDSSVLYKLAYELQYSDQDYMEALKVYKRIVDQFPDSPEAEYAQSQIINLENLSDKRLHSISSKGGKERSQTSAAYNHEPRQQPQPVNNSPKLQVIEPGYGTPQNQIPKPYNPEPTYDRPASQSPLAVRPVRRYRVNMDTDAQPVLPSQPEPTPIRSGNQGGDSTYSYDSPRLQAVPRMQPGLDRPTIPDVAQKAVPQPETKISQPVINSKIEPKPEFNSNIRPQPPVDSRMSSSSRPDIRDQYSQKPQVDERIGPQSRSLPPVETTSYNPKPENTPESPLNQAGNQSSEARRTQDSWGQNHLTTPGNQPSQDTRGPVESRHSTKLGQTGDSRGIDPKMLQELASLRSNVKALNEEFRDHKAGIAGMLSTILPGLGQIYAGAIFRGMIWVSVWVIGLALFFSQGSNGNAAYSLPFVKGFGLKQFAIAVVLFVIWAINIRQAYHFYQDDNEE
jgi:hypothetical protein